MEPFPTDKPLRFAHLGWWAETRPMSRGVELRRASPDQPEPRVVYRASLEPKAWSAFSKTIESHHRDRGFGPFLAGLRAVRTSAEEMVTLRDTTLTVYRATTWSRVEVDESAVRDVLRDRLHLGRLPVDDAVDAWIDARRAAP